MTERPDLTPREQLLVACCHPDLECARAAWQRLQGHGSEDTLGWALSGSEQRLLPLLGERADDLYLDDRWRTAVAEATAISWGLNERLLTEVTPVLDAWRDAGIEVLCLKGLGLLGDVHPALHLRAIGDADLLVRPDRVPDALRIMRRLGWRVRAGGPHPAVPAGPEHREPRERHRGVDRPPPAPGAHDAGGARPHACRVGRP